MLPSFVPQMLFSLVALGPQATRTNDPVASPEHAADKMETIAIQLTMQGSDVKTVELSGALSDHNVCMPTNRGWIHSVSHGPLIPGFSEQYFSVPIYVVAFNVAAPHIRPGTDGNDGFTMIVDDFNIDHGSVATGISADVRIDGLRYYASTDDAGVSATVRVEPSTKLGELEMKGLRDENGNTLELRARWVCGASAGQ